MSTTLSLLVVDDEPRARGLIRKMVCGDPELEIAMECSNGYDAVRAVKAGGIDVMLLDVQMPEMDGFALLRELRGWDLPAVIFVTAFDQYAVRAFEEHALDYLLKPFDKERLYRALRRAQKHLRARENSHQAAQISEMIAHWKTKQSYLDYLTVTSNGRIRLLPVREIECILAEDNYIRIQSPQTSYLLRDSISKILTVLDPKQFLRVHRSAVINLEAVQQIEPHFHGDYAITLKGGKQVSLSRTYRDAFFHKFGRAR